MKMGNNTPTSFECDRDASTKGTRGAALRFQRGGRARLEGGSAAQRDGLKRRDGEELSGREGRDAREGTTVETNQCHDLDGREIGGIHVGTPAKLRVRRELVVAAVLASIGDARVSGAGLAGLTAQLAGGGRRLDDQVTVGAHTQRPSRGEGAREGEDQREGAESSHWESRVAVRGSGVNVARFHRPGAVHGSA